MLLTTVNRTKTDELIEVSFGYGFRFDLGGAGSLQRKGQCFFGGISPPPIVKYTGYLACSVVVHILNLISWVAAVMRLFALSMAEQLVNCRNTSSTSVLR